MQYGELFIVATPIGHLGDMVPRAVETLQTADVIAAEDTRHSAKLLSHFNIDTPLMPYHDHSDSRQTNALLERLLAGQTIALISDAGTPLISDPGYRLVRAARAAGIRVIPIPGACAAIAALSAAGLPSDQFLFIGFLPAKSAARRTRLETFAKATHTSICYEAPHRIEECLKDVVAVLGPEREVVMARELTKTFETFLCGSAAEVLAAVQNDGNQRKGEIVLMLAPPPPDAQADDDPEARRVLEILRAALSTREAVALTAQITGLKKNRIYKMALDEGDSSES